MLICLNYRFVITYAFLDIRFFSVKVTMANVDDKKPVSEIIDELCGCLYGDKGYISGLLERKLADKRVTLITGIKNMKPKIMKLWNCLILWKRFIIETVLTN
uniref:transposase n=1 Tax=Candidatus Enterovibrio escicola TaxID=1927127 RepID=UPI0037449B35